MAITRNRPELHVVLQPAGDVEAGDLGKLDVHQDEVWPMLARKRQHFVPAPGLEHAIAPRLEEVVEELHIKLIVLDDQDDLRHGVRPKGARDRARSSAMQLQVLMDKG